MKSYLLNFTYLVFILGSFHWYARLLLSQHHIEYHHYGIALIEALVLAKVIMIGDILHIGRRVKGRPLIIPTLYRAVTFSIWLGLFKIVEHIISSLVHGKNLADAVNELTSYSPYEMLAMCVVTVCAFVPFFAFKELEHTVGEAKVFEMFLKKA